MTTSKRRSLLHGQTYDPKKSLRTVAVLKDRIIATKKGASAGVAMTMDKDTIYPDLGGDDEQSRPTLPTAEWRVTLAQPCCGGTGLKVRRLRRQGAGGGFALLSSTCVCVCVQARPLT